MISIVSRFRDVHLAIASARLEQEHLHDLVRQHFLAGTDDLAIAVEDFLGWCAERRAHGRLAEQGNTLGGALGQLDVVMLLDSRLGDAEQNADSIVRYAVLGPNLDLGAQLARRDVGGLAALTLSRC